METAKNSSLNEMDKYSSIIQGVQDPLPLLSPSKKIHKSSPIFQINTKFFYKLMTKHAEIISPIAQKRENIYEIGKKLSNMFKKIGENRLFFPDYLISYLYTILKNPNSFSSNFIEDIALFQNGSSLPITLINNEAIKEFESQWLDMKIQKNFESNDRGIQISHPKTFVNLSKIIKLEPKRLESLFYQCNCNLNVFLEYLKTRDKKMLWNEIEDKVLKTGKEKNQLAYELLLFYKGNEKRLMERAKFLNKEKKNGV